MQQNKAKETRNGTNVLSAILRFFRWPKEGGRRRRPRKIWLGVTGSAFGWNWPYRTITLTPRLNDQTTQHRFGKICLTPASNTFTNSLLVTDYGHILLGLIFWLFSFQFRNSRIHGISIPWRIFWKRNTSGGGDLRTNVSAHTWVVIVAKFPTKCKCCNRHG